jgi:hypothetical protein
LDPPSPKNEDNPLRILVSPAGACEDDDDDEDEDEDEDEDPW